jgi:hypothetical protein
MRKEENKRKFHPIKRKQKWKILNFLFEEVMFWNKPPP